MLSPAQDHNPQKPVRFFGLPEALLTFCAAAGWYAAYLSRTSVIQTVCQQSPASCSPDTLNRVDRLWLVNYHAGADTWSFATEYLSGFMVLILALTLSIRTRKVRILTVELWLLLQATLLNGVINECLRLWIQRPRPFVYLDPVGQGGAAAHYTSFYSGHTSFSALASTCAVLAAHRWPTPGWAKKATLVLGVLLIILTGGLRVMAGRHFITDTLAGALFGILIAWSIHRAHEISTPLSD